MVKINKIYTRTGDDGKTHLVGGERVEKDSLRVEAYGDLDELNSLLGMARTLAEQQGSPLGEKLAVLQNELFDLGALLATPAGETSSSQISVSSDQVLRLESWIDELVADLEELRSFVLPGGSNLNSWLHIARTVCRRVERRVIRLAKEEEVPRELVKYLNRLSDCLFAMGRYESHSSGIEEFLWKPGG